MRLNSDASLQTAAEVFRNYGESWEAVRAAAIGRDPDGALIVPREPAAKAGAAHVGGEIDILATVASAG